MEKLLVTTIAIPLVGALVMWVLAPLGRCTVRWGALVVTLLTCVAASYLVANFPTDPAEQASYAVTTVVSGSPAWADVRLDLGLDGLGLWLFALTPVLMVTSVLVSWKAIDDREPLFYGMLLLLEFGCLGVFTARDILLFYVFFEFTLIPLFFLIGIWGSEERRYAAVKFFVYTLAGSMLTFLGLLAIVLWCYSRQPELTFSIPRLESILATNSMPLMLQLVLFWALFAGFAIKVPLFPLHTWLPLAHVQAPAAGSIILAGVLLKIGTYGFVRFNMALLPDATAVCMPILLWLSVIGILYGAFVSLAQTDMKRLIAYSSVSHLGFVMLGLFALNPLGLQGGTLQMVNHGISTGALFALVGMLYERYHTREIRQLSGLAKRLPWLAFFMVVFTMSSIGLPGMNGFVGEFLILIGMFQRAWAESGMAVRCQFLTIAVLAVSGVVLGAWYMLWLVQRVFFGPLHEPHAEGEHEPIRDLSIREILALAPLAVLVLWIGLAPGYFLRRMDSSLERVRVAVQKPLQERLTETKVSLRD